MTALGENGVIYDDDFKANAILIAQQAGISGAVKQTGADKRSIARWLEQAGIDPETVVRRNSLRQNARAEAAVAARRLKIAEFKEQMADHLILIGQLAARVEVEFLQGEREITKRVDEKGKVLGFEHVKLSEVVGSRTRALHDLLLLNDEATERSEYRPSTQKMTMLRDELKDRREARSAEAS